MRALQLTLVALVACGGRPPPPKPPPPLDAKQLAALIYSDLTTLGDMAQRLRGQCTELIAELRPHVSRMKLRHTDVEQMLRDANQATALKAELAIYANQIKGLSDKIAADLGATYLTCTDRYQLERVIADMPTY